MLMFYRVMVLFPGRKRHKEVWCGYDVDEAIQYRDYYKNKGYNSKIIMRRFP